MVQKPERGKYLTIENVRVSYNHKNDTIHLTSSDPDLPNGSFFITLNRETTTESSLRSLLKEHNLIKNKDDKPPLLYSESLMRILKNQHFSERISLLELGDNTNLSDYIYHANLMKIPTIVITPDDRLFDRVCISPGISEVDRFTLDNIPQKIYNPFLFNDKDNADFIYFALLEILGGNNISIDKQVELEEAVKFIHRKSSNGTFVANRVVEYLSASPNNAAKTLGNDLMKILSSHAFYPFNHRYKESSSNTAVTTILDVSGLDVDKKLYYEKTLQDALNNVKPDSLATKNTDMVNVSVKILQRAVLAQQIKSNDWKLIIFDMSKMNDSSGFLNHKFFVDTMNKMVGSGVSSIIIK